MKIQWLKSLLLAVGLILTGTAQAVEFSIFGDITARDSDAAGDTRDFVLGPLDLYASKRLNDKTAAFVELVFEHDGEGFVSDLERLWIKHTFNDAFQLAGGRFHSPLGYWNRTLHHGAFMQDTVGRPFFLEFEDGESGILATHSIGLFATGEYWLGKVTMGYEVGISNGPSINSSEGFNPAEKPEINASNINDANNNKSISARLTFTPDDIDLTVGLFGVTHDVGEDAESGGFASPGGTLVKQRVLGTDIRFNYEKFGFIGEYFNLNNQNKVGTIGTTTGHAYYLQASYQFITDWKVIYRHSALSFDADKDSYFKILDAQEQSHNVVALRYEIDDVNALKAEIDFMKSDTLGLEDSTSYRVQWVYIIP